MLIKFLKLAPKPPCWKQLKTLLKVTHTMSDLVIMTDENIKAKMFTIIAVPIKCEKKLLKFHSSFVMGLLFIPKLVTHINKR